MKTIEQVLRECSKQDDAYVLMNIESWWRHNGIWDREQVSHYPYDDFGEDMGWYLSVTDEWWDGLTDKQKIDVYNEFFNEA